MLLETAMDFCTNRSPIAAVRERIEEEKGFDPAEWQEMAELGWLGIAVPEAYGGLGLGLGSVVPVVESMGRALLGSPFFATTLAAQALTDGGSEEQKQTWLPKLATGMVGTVALIEEDGDWDLSNVSAEAHEDGGNLILAGTKTFVLDAATADVMIVSVRVNGEVKLLLVEQDDIDAANVLRDVVIDETRRSYTVTLDGIQVSPDNVLESACLEEVQNAALLLLAAEIAGGAAGCLKVVVEYLNTRKQFDKLIGSYQALKHPTVDILLGMEAARSHLYHAATVIDGDDARSIEIALRMAKAHGSRAFAFAGDRAVQFHGGFGFTYECDAQLFLRRALWCQYQFGDERYHRQRLAPLLLD
ncbi:MAG: acyl-CoA dehydrogenase [Gammaproteobacteria bacterium]|nr:acyl-CoA dehydrogenase [Gammaproteobacteria bacterium]